jgi:hypothetical protein
MLALFFQVCHLTLSQKYPFSIEISQVNFHEVSGLSLGSRSKLVHYEMQGGGLRLAALCNHLYITVTSLPVLRNHFDTVPVPVLTSYFPSYGSGFLHY